MIALRLALLLIGLFHAVVSGVAEHRYRAALAAGDWAGVARAARLWPLSARLREAAATLPAMRDDVAPALAIAALRRELRHRPHEPKLRFWLAYQCWRLSGVSDGTTQRQAQHCARDNFFTLERLAGRWPETKLLGSYIFAPAATLDAADGSEIQAGQRIEGRKKPEPAP